MTRRQAFVALVGSLSLTRLAGAHEIEIPEKPTYEPPAMEYHKYPGVQEFTDYITKEQKRWVADCHRFCDDAMGRV